VSHAFGEEKPKNHCQPPKPPYLCIVKTKQQVRLSQQKENNKQKVKQ